MPSPPCSPHTRGPFHFITNRTVLVRWFTLLATSDNICRFSLIFKICTKTFIATHGYRAGSAQLRLARYDNELALGSWLVSQLESAHLARELAQGIGAACRSRCRSGMVGCRPRCGAWVRRAMLGRRRPPALLAGRLGSFGAWRRRGLGRGRRSWCRAWGRWLRYSTGPTVGSAGGDEFGAVR